jgi:hypothetical protein
VTVTATPNPEYKFTGFAGDLAGTVNNRPLTMSAPRSVFANFEYALNPAVQARIRNNVTRAAQPGPNVAVALQLTNTGVGLGRNLSITALSARVLAPAPASLPVNKGLPEPVGDLAPGASSRDINVPLVIPATATRIVLVISGTVENHAGVRHSFSTSVTILR